MTVAWDRGQELESGGGRTVGVGVWGHPAGGGGQERESGAAARNVSRSLGESARNRVNLGFAFSQFF
jgi:hypothetical protein